MKEIFVIEGIDGAGKSTLVETLHEDRRFDVVRHFGPPTSPNVHEEYREPIQRALDSGAETFVLDRWLLGEYVWPKMVGRSPIQGGQIGMWEIESWLRSQFGRIHCYLLLQPFHQIGSCDWAERHGYKQGLLTAQELYRSAATKSTLNWAEVEFDEAGLMVIRRTW